MSKHIYTNQKVKNTATGEEYPLSSIPSNWVEGQEVFEGKDFEINRPKVLNGQGEWEGMSNDAVKDFYPELKLIAIPIAVEEVKEDEIKVGDWILVKDKYVRQCTGVPEGKYLEIGHKNGVFKDVCKKIELPPSLLAPSLSGNSEYWQRRCEELKFALEYLMEGVSGLPPLRAIEGTLIRHFAIANAALESLKQSPVPAGDKQRQ